MAVTTNYKTDSITDENVFWYRLSLSLLSKFYAYLLNLKISQLITLKIRYKKCLQNVLVKFLCYQFIYL